MTSESLSCARAIRRYRTGFLGKLSDAITLTAIAGQSEVIREMSCP